MTTVDDADHRQLRSGEGAGAALVEALVQVGNRSGRKRVRCAARRSAARPMTSRMRRIATTKPSEEERVDLRAIERPRKLQKPAASARAKMTMMSAMRSMKIVPTVREIDAAVVGLQQVGPIQVAELGRHEAVHEPATGRGSRCASRNRICVPTFARMNRQRKAAERECRVVGDERQQQAGRDSRSRISSTVSAEVDVERPEEEGEEDEREDDRADGAPVEDAPGQADLALGDRLVGRRAEELARLVDRLAARASARRAGRMADRSVARLRSFDASGSFGRAAPPGWDAGSAHGSTCSGDSGPRIGPVAVRRPRQASNDVASTPPSGS